MRAKLKAGSILYLHVNFTTPPKLKYVVVVHVDGDDHLLLVFLINSIIHPLVERNPYRRACQKPIRKSDYSFLLNEVSYLNCDQLFDDLDYDETIDFLVAHPDNHLGYLLDSEINEVIQAVNAAQTIAEYDKNLIITSLDG